MIKKSRVLLPMPPSTAGFEQQPDNDGLEQRPRFGSWRQIPLAVLHRTTSCMRLVE